MDDNCNKSILLVEDNLGHAELIIRAIHDNKICNGVHHVLDGSDALDYLYHQGRFTDTDQYPHPDLILMDLRLPKVNGLEVLKQIKEHVPTHFIPVVVLTTSEADKDIAQAYHYHANSYIVKPMDFGQFRQVMQHVCDYWLKMNRIP